MPRIYSKRKGAEPPPPDAVYVGRGTPWGNPFSIGQAIIAVGERATREQVCDCFESYAVRRLRREPDWLEPLIGKDLVCWCAPKRCHAETLLRLANREQDEP